MRVSVCRARSATCSGWSANASGSKGVGVVGVALRVDFCICRPGKRQIRSGFKRNDGIAAAGLAALHAFEQKSVGALQPSISKPSLR